MASVIGIGGLRVLFSKPCLCFITTPLRKKDPMNRDYIPSLIPGTGGFLANRVAHSH